VEEVVVVVGESVLVLQVSVAEVWAWESVGAGSVGLTAEVGVAVADDTWAVIVSMIVFASVCVGVESGVAADSVCTGVCL
jgi:hypothetical protein